MKTLPLPSVLAVTLGARLAVCSPAHGQTPLPAAGILPTTYRHRDEALGEVA